MAELRKVRVQLLDTNTGEVLENVDVKTSDGAVLLADGTTLRDLNNQFSLDLAMNTLSLNRHLEEKHLTQSEIDGLLANLDYDNTTGELIITKQDGSKTSVPTALGKIAVGLKIVDGKPGTAEEGHKYLEMKLEDGSTVRADLTELVDIYRGSYGKEIEVRVDSKNTITAELVSKSISMDKLDEEVQKHLKSHYMLEVGGTDIGGVKNGGNVIINRDGTMDVDLTNVELKPGSGGFGKSTLYFMDAGGNMVAASTFKLVRDSDPTRAVRVDTLYPMVMHTPHMANTNDATSAEVVTIVKNSIGNGRLFISPGDIGVNGSFIADRDFSYDWYVRFLDDKGEIMDTRRYQLIVENAEVAYCLDDDHCSLLLDDMAAKFVTGTYDIYCVLGGVSGISDVTPGGYERDKKPSNHVLVRIIPR